jgi:hypothetical protein
LLLTIDCCLFAGLQLLAGRLFLFDGVVPPADVLMLRGLFLVCCCN